MTSEALSVEKVEGRGIPIVFVHGWLGSKESWKQVREELDIEKPLVFYDQRCHGESPCSEFRMEDLADDLGKVVGGLDEKPVIVGHSMGGMAALRYATNNDDYQGLVLFGTCASTPRPKYRSPKFFLEKLGELAREKWAEKIADNYAEDSPEVREGAVKELKNAGREPIIHGLKAMIDYDVRDELGKENAVVVAGEKDSAITVEQCREVSDILGCELKTLDSSHLMLQETPAEVAEEIEAFAENQ
ncbi:MAG: alpha/beta fold hydrolase [Candidatus Nanohaloarchaea archaeon]